MTRTLVPAHVVQRWTAERSNFDAGPLMHTSSTFILVLAVFGACLVEMVEALTLVVAAGVSRGWRSALEGAAAAVLVLGVLVVAVGVPLIRYVPIDALRVVVGALLLVLGLGWLRKAILRSSGHKALHDEDAIYAETVAELGEDSGDGATGKGKGKGRDAVGFAVAFKGVFLEGTEVVLIVISLGAAQHRLGLAALGRGGCHRPGHDRRDLGLAPAQRGAGEHDQDRRGHHAQQLRPLLGRRGCRRALARFRPGHPRARRLLRRGLLRVHGAHAHVAARAR